MGGYQRRAERSTIPLLEVRVLAEGREVQEQGSWYTVVGVIDDGTGLNQAVTEVRELGVDRDDLTVVLKRVDSSEPEPFPDGTRLFAQGRHMTGCWGFFGDIIHGSTGSAVLGEGIPKPRIFKGHDQTAENQIWNYKGPRTNAYQVEHELLFDAIRNNKPYNETDRCAKAAMTGILGRMAAESGKMITWEQAFNSKLVLAPGLDDYTMDSNPPVMPDENGNYPIAMPGVTNVL